MSLLASRPSSLAAAAVLHAQKHKAGLLLLTLQLHDFAELLRWWAMAATAPA